ncbi:MAG TPA: hypothetical protein VH915_01665 [Pedococcus sp.]
MRAPTPAVVVAAGAVGLLLAGMGVILPSAVAWVAGVLLAGAAAALLLRRRLPTWQAVAAVVVAVAAAVALPVLLRPGSEGLAGDWSARAVEGEVVAGRAVVGRDNTAVDLRTGTTVRLGSVTGGRRWVGDDRLVVVTDGRVDSVRLDATARWTWRTPPGSTTTPVAADRDHTVLLSCTGSGTCTLVGLDGRGRRVWATGLVGAAAGAGRAAAGDDPATGALPRVAAVPDAGGDGVFLTDPLTGQRTLVPGADALPLTDGTVAVSHTSGGSCVVSRYAAPQPLSTRVTEGACDGEELGRTADEVARATGTSVEATQIRSGANPFRSPRQETALVVRRAGRAEPVARLVSDETLTALRVEESAVVVREGDRIVRYTLGTA